MAFKLAELFVDVFARTNRLTSGFDKVELQTNKLARGLSKLSDAATAAIGGLALVRFFDKVVTASMEAERSVNLVKAALRNNGQEVTDNTKKIDGMANALRDQVGFSDEAARSAAAYAIKMGASADQAIEMTKAAAGLSDLFGGNLQSAMQAVTRAQQGNWMSLQRMIPALRQYHTVQEKMDFLVRRANQGIASQKELLKDTRGHVTQLENAWSELSEAIGDQFNPVVIKTLEYLTLLTKALTPGTVEQNSALTQFRKELYETQIAVLEFVRDHRVLANVLMPALAMQAPNTDDANKQITELHKNIDYIIDLEKKMNHVAEDANDTNVKGINAVNSALTKQQRILSGMPAYWKKVQESFFNPDIMFGAGRGGGGGGGAGGGRIAKKPPSGLMPTQMGSAASGGGTGSTGGTGAGGRPFRTQPGYMGSGGPAGMPAVVMGPMGVPMIGPPVPPAGTEAHRKWLERWEAHKGAHTDTSDPTKVGGVHVDRNVVRNREWHRKNVERLNARIAWRQEQLTDQVGEGYTNFNRGRGGRNDNVYQQSILDRDKKEQQRSSDIAEFGSTTKADFERWKVRDRQATQAKVNRTRLHLLSKATTEAEIQDAAKTADENAAYEQKKMEKRQANFWDKSFKQKYEEERKKLETPVDREAESVRKGLQTRFGVTGPTSGAPLKVDDVNAPKLVGAINNLAKSIHDMNAGTFGEDEEE